MQENLYYFPPLNDQFEELREAAITIWATMGDEPSYSEEKIGQIENIGNVGDNFMYMVAMFDINNQRRLADMISDDTKAAVRARMVAGGTPPEYNVF